MSEEERSLLLGRAVMAIIKSRRCSRRTVSWLVDWLVPAIRHKQIYFFRDDGGSECGYVIWAWLAGDVERRLLMEPNKPLHISEWNEGSNLWFLGLFVNTGNIRIWIKEVRRLFPHVERAKSLRRRGDGSVRRVTTWKAL